MHVKMKILGAVDKPMGKSEVELCVPDGATIEQVMLAGGYRKEHLKWFLVARNGVDAKLPSTVSDGDEISVVFPTSGG